MPVATEPRAATVAGVRCHRHLQVAAAWQCTACSRGFCDPCFREAGVDRTHAESCPQCRGFCRSLGRAGPRPPESMAEILADAFAYPLRDHGLVVIALGAVFFTFLTHLRGYGYGPYRYLAFLFLVLALGYLSAFLFQVISVSAIGERKLPAWPDFTDIWDCAVLPLVQMAAPSLACLVPAVIPILILGWNREAFTVACVVAGAASFYVPMAVLAIALNNSITAMHPAVVLPAIKAVPGPYLVIWLVVAGLEALSCGILFLITRNIPLVGFALHSMIAFFLLTVEMRLLGLLHLRYAERLRLV